MSKLESASIDFSNRESAPGVNPQFVQRWSPRVFKPAPIADQHLLAILDAARWSPSCFNEQPWRFYLSQPHTFDDYLNLLLEGNQAWAKDAGVLGVLSCKTHFSHNGKENSHARFDAGAAWMAMSLQAREMGYYTHGMAGIKRDQAISYLNLDTEQEDLIMMFAIGTLADRAELSTEQLQKETPNGRKPLTEIWPNLGGEE